MTKQIVNESQCKTARRDPGQGDGSGGLMDGDKEFTTICGTGTEDCFCVFYGFDNTETSQYQAYTTPYVGFHKIIKPDGKYKSQMRFGMYRLHITDTIRFGGDLKVTSRHLDGEV